LVVITVCETKPQNAFDFALKKSSEIFAFDCGFAGKKEISWQFARDAGRKWA